MTVTIDLLASELATASHVKPETVQFLLQLQKQEFDLDAYLVDAKQADPSKGIEHIDKVLQDLKARHANSEIPHRAQLIVHNTGHYTALDIEICKGEITNSFILDAAGDMRFMSVAGALAKAKAPDETMYITSADSSLEAVADAKKPGETRSIPARMRPIQSDRISCPYFCLDHVLQVAKISTIYADLKKSVRPEDDMMPGVNWTDLPPQLVWNVQSLSWAKEYAEMNPERANAEIVNGKSFTSYVKEGTVHDAKMGKDINKSIEINVFRPLQEKGLYYLSQSTPQQLTSLLQESYKPHTAKEATPSPQNTKEIFKALRGEPTGEIEYKETDFEFNKISQDKNEKTPEHQPQEPKHESEYTEQSTPVRKM